MVLAWREREVSVVMELEDVWMPASARHTHGAADRNFGELF
jgi:hypothetical protein